MTIINKRLISKRQTRAKILSAARAVWSVPGSYEASTMRVIAKAAGVSTGAIFSNWVSKDALWLDAMGYPAPRDCQAVREALQALCSPVMQEAA